MERSTDDLGRDGSSSRVDLQADNQIILAEYSALRAEIDRRATVQWSVFALQITSAGAISGVAISTASNFALFLIIPLVSYMLGSRYILHDFHIKIIQRYVGESLSGRLSNGLKWERWKKEKFSDVRDRRWFHVAGWTVLHPTRLAFEGVAALALAAAAVSATYNWWSSPTKWALVVGFALMWTLGALATCLLHRSFERASGDIQR